MLLVCWKEQIGEALDMADSGEQHRSSQQAFPLLFHNRHVKKTAKTASPQSEEADVSTLNALKYNFTKFSDMVLIMSVFV